MRKLAKMMIAPTSTSSEAWTMEETIDSERLGASYDLKVMVNPQVILIQYLG